MNSTLVRLRCKSLCQIVLQRRTFENTAGSNKEVEITKLNGKDDGITILSLNRPKARNALSLNLVETLHEYVKKIKSDSDARVLILRSSVPKIFCAGADLKERSSFTQKQVADFLNKLQSLLTDIERIPVPVIVGLDGAAVGGGLEMSLACDIRIASNDIKLGLVETKLAIIPGAGGTQRLPRLINPAVAKELIFTAKLIDSTEAHKLGIINHVVDQNDSNDAAYQKALEIARKILPNGPIAIKMAKKAIDVGLQMDLNSGLEVEKACYGQLIPTKDRVEGFTAFIQKRNPVFKGE